MRGKRKEDGNILKRAEVNSVSLQADLIIFPDQYFSKAVDEQFAVEKEAAIQKGMQVCTLNQQS